METEKLLSPQESLNIITEAIAKTKDNFRENSFCFLLWGWLIAIASILFFILEKFTAVSYYFIPFPVLGGIGIIITFMYYQKKKASTQTHLNNFLLKLWAVLAVAFIITVFINVSHKQLPFTDTLIIAGIGTLLSGWVMKFKPLVIGGIIFLLMAIASVYIENEYKALIHGLAILTGYLIPGYLLKQSKV
ncbi:hypothetical protein [Solitalea canadensis]|uniref:Uncharacterized protein n=1 Tax=Solitalea canadensis (strain ATCC 29591 / DSM 3403 / JCM 21819 / LMG 8368 / NBRC 15130 / NCIMB 12057 / USAM 9D) TaxID=929556 RepID=H8KTY3_SOLCM|nr:hypothetical protein [Solitalea canadensis]AFD06833.1 hypothetical protein Solca_1767 [Solitalea canadensis DSM 3403]